MSAAIGGVLVLFGAGLAIKGFDSNSKYGVLWCVLGAFLAGKGAVMLGVF